MTDDHTVDRTNMIPPCPVCGEEPTHVICDPGLNPSCCEESRYRFNYRSDWDNHCYKILGRALRTNGIHTIQQLTDRLAPDPRVAVLESYGVSTADETACLIMLAARGSRTEIHTTEKLDDTLVLSVIKNLRSIGETQMFASLKRIAAQRGEG